MIISHQHKFIFFGNAKTGTTSITSVLGNLNEVHTIQKQLDFVKANDPSFIPDRTLRYVITGHIRPRFIRKAVGEEIWNSYFKFVFVRNPWDWVLSQYHQNFVNIRHRIKHPLHLFQAVYYSNLGLKNNQKFTEKDFFRHWEKMKNFRGIKEETNYFQYQFIEESNGEKMVDFVGKYENLEADFNYVCDLLSLKNTKLPVLNKSKEKLSYQKMYTDEAKILVEEKYKKDIDLLGYSF